MVEYLGGSGVQRLHHPLEESQWWPILGSVIWSLLAIATGIPALIIIALFCPICMAIKWLSDSFSNKREAHGNDSQVLHAVFVFAGKLQVKTLQELIVYRVIPRYPKLTCKMLNHCGLWIADPKFHISNHVFSASGSSKQDTQWSLDGLANDKSPWELQLFEGSDETIAVFRYHHNLVEIHVLVNLLCTALADTSTSYIEVSGKNTFQFCIELVRACILAPLTILFWFLISSKDRNILTDKPLWTGRIHLTWSSGISLSKVTRIKQVTRSTTNCVLLSTLAGAIRKFFQSCGVTQPPNMQILIPMSQFGIVWPVLVPLAVGTEGAVPRIWDTRAILRRLKSNSEPLIGFLTMSTLLSTFPQKKAYSVIKKLIQQKASLQFSSVIGPESSLFVGGCPLKSLYAMFPPPQSEVGLAVTVITYAGKIFVTVLSDASLSTVASVLLHHLKSQIDILDHLLKNRRVPSDKKNSIYRFRNVTHSPIKELAHRLSHIQHEILRISDKTYSEGSSDNLNMLKAEFTYVLKELQRRKMSHVDNIQLTMKNRRTVSCPFIHAISRVPNIARPHSAVPSPYCIFSGAHICSYSSPNKYTDSKAHLVEHHKEIKTYQTATHNRSLVNMHRHSVHIDAEITSETSTLTRKMSINFKDNKHDECSQRRHSAAPCHSHGDLSEITVISSN